MSPLPTTWSAAQSVASSTPIWKTRKPGAFRANPLALILRDRGKYVAAGLTIARAYIDAGKPEMLPPLASYEDWSNVVRSPLVWLGFPDPVGTMESARAADPVRQDRASLFQAWRDE